MIYHKCEVCGEKFNLLTLDSEENKQSYIIECPKCRAKYKTPKMTKKKMYAFAIPIAIICVLGYIFFRQYFDLDPFYGKVMIVIVVCASFMIFCINYIKNLKIEKIDENDRGNINEQSS